MIDIDKVIIVLLKCYLLNCGIILNCEVNYFFSQKLYSRNINANKSFNNFPLKASVISLKISGKF